MLKTKVKNILAVTAFSLASIMTTASAAIDENLSIEEITTIAKEAYIYGYPMVDHYRGVHSFSIDTESDQYKGPINEIASDARVFTYEDTSIQTPNSDTPFSFVHMDLRAEPLILSIPKIEDDRYLSIQFIDMFSHNTAYAGSRTTGNNAQNILVATEAWNGEVPVGIDHVIRIETEFVMAVNRTQLFNEEDLDRVAEIQSQFKVATLSEFLGKPAKPVPAVTFIEPAKSVDEMKSSLVVYQQLGYLLGFAPVHESEVELREKFAKIGIAPGKTFDPAELTAEQLGAFTNGIKAAWAEFMEGKALADQGKITSGDIFGDREHLNNQYVYRWMAAVLGLWGNTAEEAIYPSYFIDSDGEQLNGKNNYELYFPAGQLPPVNSFWSLTLYKLPESLLSQNDLNRYLLNSAMMEQLKFDEKGGLRLYVQSESPGKDKESNWLPAPEGDFSLVLRLYWPKEIALTNEWKEPAVNNVSK